MRVKIIFRTLNGLKRLRLAGMERLMEGVNWWESYCLIWERLEPLDASVHLNISADEHLPAGAEKPWTTWKALNPGFPQKSENDMTFPWLFRDFSMTI